MLKGLNDISYGALTDEITSFVTCVEQKLRNIKHARARTIAQHVINSVLFQAEMTNYADDFKYTGVNFTLFENTSESESKESTQS